MEIKVAQILNNPCRDLKKNPFIKDKIEPLMENIKRLGFWDNVIVRVKDNDLTLLGLAPTGDVKKDAAMLEAWCKNKKKFPEDVPVELGYGHYRIEALRRINKESEKKRNPIDVINIPVKYITDEDMRLTMISENSNDWGHGVMTQLESVQSVYIELKRQLNEFDKFEDYFEKYGEKDYAYDRPNSWTTAREKQEIGWEKVNDYVGGQMAQNDIKGALLAIKASEKGYFDLEDCHDMQTGSALMHVIRTVTSIHEGKDIDEKLALPDFFKDMWTQQLFANQRIKRNAEEQTCASVKVLSQVNGKFKKRFHPITFIEDNKNVLFNVPDLFADYLWTKEIFDEKEAMSIEGIDGFEIELMEGLEKAVARKIAVAKAKEKKEQAQQGDQGNIQEPSGNEQTGDTPVETGPPLSSDNHVLVEATGPVVRDVKTMTGAFVAQSKYLTKIVTDLKDHVTEIDNDNTEFFEELDRSTQLSVSLFIAANGRERFDELVETVMTIEQNNETDQEEAKQSASA